MLCARSLCKLQNLIDPGFMNNLYQDYVHILYPDFAYTLYQDF